MTSNQSLHDKSILVVEDNMLNQEYMCEILSDYDANISLAVNGSEAVNKILLDDDRFDLVFMDIQMPVMDGISATEIIREKYNKDTLPIIAVTANTSNEDKVKCLSAGMNKFVTKPVSVKTIREIISTFTNISRTSKTIKQVKNVTNESLILNDIDFTELFSILKNNIEAAARMLSGFVEKYNDIDIKIKRLLDNSEFNKAGDLIHTIKGTSGNLTLKAIYELSLKIEAFIKDNNSEGAMSLLPMLKNELDKLQHASMQLSNKRINRKDSETSTKKNFSNSLKSQLLEIDQHLQSNYLGALDEFIAIQNDLVSVTSDNAIKELENRIKTLEFKRASKKLREIIEQLD